MFRLMEKARKNNNGFSLVELIVVVLIIAIIAVALAPQVVKYVQKSRDNVALNNAATIKSAVQAAVAEYQGDTTSTTYELTKEYTFTVAQSGSAIGGADKDNLPKKLKDNIYFESMLPKYNPIVNLKTFSFNNLDAKLQKSINKISSKGLSLIKGDFYNINSLYELTKRKEDKESNYYKSMYKIFDGNNLIDLFLVEVDYHEYLLNLQDDHETEATINEKINKIFQMDPTNKNIYNEKMLSDRKLYEINEYPDCKYIAGYHAWGGEIYKKDETD